ncbi:acyl-CoA thioesterase/bile acid-CoA:amino acid N-acyltransferase family protein [Kitasatospora acidiphila]|uniref:acyl-CoA thioesterase/bile acid-CoA:amino acid N-acyltransferase family protein n=1 Tax=Kitasatospora acidiphila TaxID=2567942 RepID=UPI0022659C9F|nr:acyl-CoA thioester hydrolase/BAAT C-terminal domain-containing protein [Kitasatospora acidiphila]
MGLFWSMGPAGGDPDQASFGPKLSTGPAPGFPVDITVTAHGRQLATTTLTREVMSAGVTTKQLTQASDQVTGELFLPPATAGRHPAVLLLGGSEGGFSSVGKLAAAQLASHGYPALVVAYFHLPGLPDTLQNIPLEYFATAAHLLAAQPQTDPAHIVVEGDSRGSEAALLLAQDYPDLFHGSVLYAPSAQVNRGFPTGDTAWTFGGRPVPTGDIPVDRVNGPVLAIAGSDDKLWNSAPWARQIDAALTAANRPGPHQALVYPGAGHFVGVTPYLPEGTHLAHPVTKDLEDLGGTRAGDAAAQAAGWPKVLELLAAAAH